MRLTSPDMLALAVLPLLVLSCGGEPTTVDKGRVVQLQLSGCESPIDPGTTCTIGDVQRDATGTEVDTRQPLSWRSDNPAIATVRVGGVVTGVTDGTTSIHATVGGVTAFRSVTVRSTVARVTLQGCTAVLDPDGAGCVMSAIASSVDGRVLPDRLVSWSSEAPGIAGVDANGTVTPLARGHARIRATIEGVTADTLVAVGTPVYSVTIEGCAGVIPPSSTCMLLARAFAADGRSVTGGPPTWTSTEPEHVEVAQDGGVTGHRVGTSLVSVQVDGVGAETTLEVGGFASIALRNQGGCGLKSDGRAFCWGRNDHGQVGDGTLVTRNSPVSAIGGTTLRDVTFGDGHGCAISATERALCWGRNDHGQLGDGTGQARLVAVSVPGLFFRDIDAGAHHTCGIATDDDTYCWGTNISGTVGLPFPSSDVLSPNRVPGGHRFAALAAGSYHTCGLDPSHRAWCWGSGGEGQLGNGTALSSFNPVQVSGGLSFRQLGAGPGFTCGLSTAYEVYCWGRNQHGQYGDGTTTPSLVPVRVLSGLGFDRLVVQGFEHACALTPDGEAWCWGRNTWGQIDPAQGEAVSTPAPVGGGQRYESVAVGGSSICALRASGRIDCWGPGAPAPPMP